MRHSLLLKTLILLVCLAATPVISAQSIDRVRVNEIQVINTDGLRDEYGHRGSWIELFNSGYNKVNIGGCYIKINGKEYRIPVGDPRTVMSTRGYAVFYAAGTPDKGTFHTNLNLENANLIEFYDVDKNLIDKFEFNPADMKENVSYGWVEGTNGKEILAHLPAVTPGANNNTADKTARGETFRKADPIGIVLTLTNIVAVGIALSLLYFIFKNTGKFFIRQSQKKTVKSQSTKEVPAKISTKDGEYVITNEHLAAISIALYKYAEELHDTENTIITINRVVRAYSPWSSKIYGLTQMPNRK